MMKIDVNNWESDKNWTDSYWCQVKSEEEFIIAIKSLYGDRKIKNVFVGDVFESEECLFGDDVCQWHYMFNTNECDDDDLEFMTHPYEFNGTFDENSMPDFDEYPLMMNLTIVMNERQLGWHHIK